MTMTTTDYNTITPQPAPVTSSDVDDELYIYWRSPPKPAYDPDPGAEQRWIDAITIDERVLREDD